MSGGWRRFDEPGSKTRTERFHDACDRGGDSSPGCCLTIEFLSARVGQAVVLRSTVVVGETPLRSKQPSHLEAVQGGVERPFIDFEDLGRSLLNGGDDRIAVHRLALSHALEDQHVERPWYEQAGIHPSHKLFRGEDALRRDSLSTGAKNGRVQGRPTRIGSWVLPW